MLDLELIEGRESLLLRGTLDMCVLGLLAASPTHAYGVVRDLQEHGLAQSSYGTIYPLVTRLRRQGLVAQQAAPGEGGPVRNILTVTPDGLLALKAWTRHWHDHNHRVSDLLAGRTTTERTA